MSYSIRSGKERCLRCFLLWFHHNVWLSWANILYHCRLREFVEMVNATDLDATFCQSATDCHWVQDNIAPDMLSYFWSKLASPLQRNPLLHRCLVGIFHHFGSEMIWVFSPLGKSWDWSDAFHLSQCKERQVAAGSCRVNQGNLWEVPRQFPVLEHCCSSRVSTNVLPLIKLIM